MDSSFSFTQIFSQFPMPERHVSFCSRLLLSFTWRAEANDEIMTAAVSWVPSSSRMLRVACVSTFGDHIQHYSTLLVAYQNSSIWRENWKVPNRILRHPPVVSEIYGKFIATCFALRTRLASSEFCASKFAKQLAKQANVVRVCKTFWGLHCCSLQLEHVSLLLVWVWAYL